MMNEIYRKYFQKSTAFLYPILGFNKNRHPLPKRTYVTWADSIKIEDKKLICVFVKKDTEAWKQFEEKFLLTHSLLDSCMELDDDHIAYVFDFNSHEADFQNFIDGKYSKLSNNVKKTLGDYYGIHTPEWVHLESYIHPSKYFEQYATILDVDVKILKDVGELCEKFNPEEESCPYVVQNA